MLSDESEYSVGVCNCGRGALVAVFDDVENVLRVGDVPGVVKGVDVPDNCEPKLALCDVMEVPVERTSDDGDWGTRDDSGEFEAWETRSLNDEQVRIIALVTFRP